MKQFPDVIGQKLTLAEEHLNQLNCVYKIVETVSRRKETIEGDYRAISQRVDGDILVLIVCKVPD